VRHFGGFNWGLLDVGRSLYKGVNLEEVNLEVGEVKLEEVKLEVEEVKLEEVKLQREMLTSETGRISLGTYITRASNVGCNPVNVPSPLDLDLDSGGWYPSESNQQHYGHIIAVVYFPSHFGAALVTRLFSTDCAGIPHAQRRINITSAFLVPESGLADCPTTAGGIFP
jgi:hypothetical protein